MGDMADHRRTAIMPLHVKSREIRPRELDEIHYPLINLRRRGGFLHENIAFMTKKILIGSFNTALFFSRHGMAGNVIHALGEPRRDLIP